MEGLGVNMGLAGNVEPAFWRDRRVLITGHTGFKGSWLAIWLTRLGARVTGVSLRAHTSPNLFGLAKIQHLVETNHYEDIRNAESITRLIRKTQPEIVFHLAAQALVGRSYTEPLTTFSTNLMGTTHVLEALRELASVRVAVMVTTDKVYQNQEWNWPYRENDPLGGSDPYSASKASSELVIASYRESFLSRQGLRIASARAGNVIGGGDWSENRLLPDAVRAWTSGRALEIRHPDAVRPWQHILEPLYAYLVLAQCLWGDTATDSAYNFGPAPYEVLTVRTIIDLARHNWGSYSLVNFAREPLGLHEAKLLTLETARARNVLGITPRWNIEKAMENTIRWYRSQLNGSDALALCNDDIDEYEAII